MINRPESNEYGKAVAGYIQLVPDGDLLDMLERQITDTIDMLKNLSEEKASFRYAPGKWSIKEVVGHMADTERIMSYRLLRFARGDSTELAGFDEDTFVLGAAFDSLPLVDLLADLKAVRTATGTLLKGISADAFLRQGSANGNVISVRALAYVICGHELHHRNTLAERYLGNNVEPA